MYHKDSYRTLVFQQNMPFLEHNLYQVYKTLSSIKNFKDKIILKIILKHLKFPHAFFLCNQIPLILDRFYVNLPLLIIISSIYKIYFLLIRLLIFLGKLQSLNYSNK